MTTVYLVTVGSYSDYMVMGVYSALELAKKAAGALGPTSDIEEFELDKHKDLLERGLKFFYVSMYKDGTLKKCTMSSWRWQLANPGYYVIDKNCVTTHLGQDYLVIYLWAKDEQHAAKIANDRRAALEGVEWYRECDPSGLPPIYICPWCHSSRGKGHRHDCPRQLALAKAKGNA